MAHSERFARDSTHPLRFRRLKSIDLPGVRHLLRGRAEQSKTRRVKFMNIERFTEKAQEALRSAQGLSTKFGQQETDVEHLLLALLDQDSGLAGAVLSRAGVSVDAVKIRLQRELEKLPRVSGGNASEDRFYVSGRLNRLLGKAEDEAKKWKDDFSSYAVFCLKKKNDPNRPGQAPVTASPARTKPVPRRD